MLFRKKKRAAAGRLCWVRSQVNPRTAGPFAVTFVVTLLLLTAIYQIGTSAKTSFDQASKALGASDLETSREKTAASQ